MGLFAWWRERRERKRAAHEAQARRDAFEAAVASAVAAGAKREVQEGPVRLTILDDVADESTAALSAVGFRRTGSEFSRTWIHIPMMPLHPQHPRSASKRSALDILHGRR